MSGAATGGGAMGGSAARSGAVTGGDVTSGDVASGDVADGGGVGTSVDEWRGNGVGSDGRRRGGRWRGEERSCRM